MTLAAVEKRYRASVAKTEALRLLRNQAVRDALAAGERPADIARATGLTRARIAQITAPVPSDPKETNDGDA